MKWFIGLVIAILSGSGLFAQTTELRGVVTDESGAIVPGAKVTITPAAGSPQETVVTNDGSYSFANISAGTYTIRATAPDLASEAAKIDLKPGTQNLNLQLKIVSANQQVTVVDQAALVTPEPSNNASATVLEGSQLDALSDNPDDLINELIAIAGPGAGSGGASIFIDGFSSGQAVSKESIREIRINQNPFSAEYDKTGMGRIEILTRPGTNQFHGSTAFNFANDSWNSRNPYAQQKAPFLLKEYSANFSGPVNRKMSYFLDLRRDAIDNGAIINGATVDPVTLTILDPFTEVFRIPQRRWNVAPRFDYQAGANNTLTFRYAHSHTDIPSSGIGGFNLISRGVRNTTISETFQATDTAVFGDNLVNEIRFQFFRNNNQSDPNTTGPSIQVLGSFNGGASPVGFLRDIQNNYELQNYTTLIHKTHSWRFGARLRGLTDDNISQQNFGGTFTFGAGNGITSIQRYQQTLQLLKAGFSPSQVASLGAGATQFSITTGDPRLTAGQFDIGAFVSDDWKVRPSVTLSLGMRYETQTNIHDRHDVAPRIAISWAPGSRGGNGQSKTVIRAGFGSFFDRFALNNTMAALRYNGIEQQQYVVANPDFFPSIPPPSALAAMSSVQTITRVSPGLVSPVLYQTNLSLERQLRFNTTLAVTYGNSHYLHLLRSRVIGSVFQAESSGLYNQNFLLVNVNSRGTKYVSLTGSYMFSRAMSNTDGINTFPASPYTLAGEYGPAGTDVRHRVTMGGSINTKWNVVLSPLLNITSGPPFDITVGHDIYGTTLFNGRPGIATDANRPGVVQTKYGLLDPNPTPDEVLLHRNYGRGPGTLFFNLRLTKNFKFDAKRPYTLSIAMATQNILNHTNPGPIVGNITSPLFGHANQPSGGGGNGGFSEAANNRRLELQTRFTF